MGARVLLATLVLLAPLGVGAAVAGPLRAVVVAPDAGSHDRKAAEELAAYLQQMVGLRLEQRTWSEAMQEQSGLIVLGPAAVPAGGFTPAEVTAAGLDGGYRVRTRGGNVYIAGGPYGGTLVGAYWFLEQLGARFYASDHEVVPELRSLQIPALDTLRRPFFELRLLLRDIRQGQHELLHVGDGRLVDPELVEGAWGVRWPCWSHTSQFLCPVDRYGRDHPEYFAQTADGRFLASEWLATPHPGEQPWNLHLCFSHPEVRHIARERLLDWMGRQPDRRWFSVCQMDGYEWCQCPACRALDTVPDKVMTDRMLDFVNDLARSAREKYPDRLILAYAYTEKSAPPPARLRPEPNVRVFLCAYTPEVEDQAHWFEHPRNRKFLPWYEGWLRAAPGQVYLYNYPLVDSRLLTFVHEAYFAKIKRLAADGVRGLYYDGRSHFMHSLFNYVSARLAWDPAQDHRALVADFITSYYGAAGPKVQEIYDYLARVTVPDDRIQGLADGRQIVTSEECAHLLGLYAEAEGLARNDHRALARVQEDKSFVLFTDLMKHNPAAGTSGDPAVFKRRLGEYLGIALRPESRQDFGRKDASWVKGWLWRLARLTLTQDNWHQDPLILQLQRDPDAVLIPDIAATNRIERLPNGVGWRVPLELFRGCEGPLEYAHECPRRTCVCLRPRGRDAWRMQASLRFPAAPGAATLAITGQDDDKPGQTRVRIVVNGQEVFRGENGFAEHDWSTRPFTLADGLLKAGENELVLENLEEGNAAFANWVLVAEVRVEPKTRLTADTLVPLLLAHFDARLDADSGTARQALLTGSFQLTDGGRWGKALDAGYSPGIHGALRYSGIGNYLPACGTAEMWVKTAWEPDTDPHYRVLLNIMGGVGQESGLLLFKYNTQSWWSWLAYCGRPGDTATGSLANWHRNEWHHIAVTWDRRAGALQIFLDGVLAGRTDQAQIADKPTDFIHVGCQLGSDHVAGALIDELRICDSVLWEGRQVGEKVFEPPTAPYPAVAAPAP